MAEWGTIAASCGREPIAGSGVLPGGELASGDVTVLGFSCKHTDTQRNRVVLQYTEPEHRQADAGGLLTAVLVILIDDAH